MNASASSTTDTASAAAIPATGRAQSAASGRATATGPVPAPGRWRSQMRSHGPARPPTARNERTVAAIATASNDPPSEPRTRVATAVERASHRAQGARTSRMPTVAMTVYATIPATMSIAAPGENGSGRAVMRIDHNSSERAKSPVMTRGAETDRCMAWRRRYRVERGSHGTAVGTWPLKMVLVATAVLGGGGMGIVAMELLLNRAVATSPGEVRQAAVAPTSRTQSTAATGRTAIRRRRHAAACRC